MDIKCNKTTEQDPGDLSTPELSGVLVVNITGADAGAGTNPGQYRVTPDLIEHHNTRGGGGVNMEK